MNLHDWALENAAGVVANVERHGISITWSEAHRRLIQSATVVDTPVYVEQPDAVPTVLDRSDPTTPWEDPGFAEEVACGTVHNAGKRYIPREPDTSSVAIALPWNLAAETVQRLSFVLALRLRALQSDGDAGPSSLAGLLVRLSSDVSFELNWTGDDDIVADHKVDGRRYLLVRSADVCRAARYLRESEAAVTAGLWPAADIEATNEFDRGLGAFLTDPESLHSLLWELDWWTTGAC